MKLVKNGQGNKMNGAEEYHRNTMIHHLVNGWKQVVNFMAIME
ncbi:hypothetical protein [Niallia endozanthoxylica]|nr:hypothetical protein [Niallia endozanthoxylica]